MSEQEEGFAAMFEASGKALQFDRGHTMEQREQAELREYAARPDAAPTASLESIADQLRGALGGR